MRRFALVPVVVLLATSLAACGNREEVRDELLDALRATEKLSYNFVYTDDRAENVVPGGTPPPPDVDVRGLVEDDFRFKARVSLNKSTAFDEVVRDDLLAMRFLDPGRVGALVNKAKLPEADTKTELEGLDSLTVLQSRRWVIDEAAAPSVTVGRVREATLGEDPVLDAITVLTYVEEAIRQAQSVQEFSPDDVTPAYSATEDVFPKPDDGSGVTRYDLRRPKLPPPGGDQATGDAGQPATRHFRRMAIYVEAGRVIQVREVVDVKGKFLKDVVKYAKTYAKAAGAPPEALEQFNDALEEVGDDQRGSLVLEGLSAALLASGEEPILRRTMTLELRDLGSKVAVDLPTQDVVKGSLGFLIVSAKGKNEDDGETSSDAGTGAPAGSATPAEGGAPPETSAPPAAP